MLQKKFWHNHYFIDGFHRGLGVAIPLAFMYFFFGLHLALLVFSGTWLMRAIDNIYIKKRTKHLLTRGFILILIYASSLLTSHLTFPWIVFLLLIVSFGGIMLRGVNPTTSSALSWVMAFLMGTMNGNTTPTFTAYFFNIAMLSCGVLGYAIVIISFEHYRPLFNFQWATAELIKQLAQCLALKISLAQNDSKDTFRQLLKNEASFFRQCDVVHSFIQINNKNSTEFIRQAAIYTCCIRTMLNYETLQDISAAAIPSLQTNLQKLYCLNNILLNPNTSQHQHWPLNTEKTKGKIKELDFFINSIDELVLAIAGKPIFIRPQVIEYITTYYPKYLFSWSALKKQMHWHSDVFRNAVRVATGFLLILIFESFFPLPNKMWPLTNFIIVSVTAYADSYEAGKNRIQGIIAGALLTLPVVMNFGYEQLLLIVITTVIISTSIQRLISLKYYAGLRVFTSLLLIDLAGNFTERIAFFLGIEKIAGIFLAIILLRIIPDLLSLRLPQQIITTLKDSAEYLHMAVLFAQKSPETVQPRLLRIKQYKNMSLLLTQWDKLKKGHKNQRKCSEKYEAKIIAVKNIIHAISAVYRDAFNGKLTEPEIQCALQFLEFFQYLTAKTTPDSLLTAFQAISLNSLSSTSSLHGVHTAIAKFLQVRQNKLLT